MLCSIDLTKNLWAFGLSAEPMDGNAPLTDTIALPSTVSQMRKSPYNTDTTPANLTDPWFFEGYALYRTEIELAPETGCTYVLHLERTRTTCVWVNGISCGTHNSLVLSDVRPTSSSLHTRSIHLQARSCS